VHKGFLYGAATAAALMTASLSVAGTAEAGTAHPNAASTVWLCTGTNGNGTCENVSVLPSFCNKVPGAPFPAHSYRGLNGGTAARLYDHTGCGVGYLDLNLDGSWHKLTGHSVDGSAGSILGH
jgi:hypothetical protein